MRSENSRDSWATRRDTDTAGDPKGTTGMELIEINPCGLLTGDHRSMGISVDARWMLALTVTVPFQDPGTNGSPQTLAQP